MKPSERIGERKREIESGMRNRLGPAVEGSPQTLNYIEFRSWIESIVQYLDEATGALEKLADYWEAEARRIDFPPQEIDGVTVDSLHVEAETYRECAADLRAAMK